MMKWNPLEPTLKVRITSLLSTSSPPDLFTNSVRPLH